MSILSSDEFNERFESLYSRDHEGRLLRMEEATQAQLNEVVTVWIDGQDVELTKATPSIDDQGLIRRDQDGLVIPRPTTIYDAAAKMRHLDIGLLPVWDGERLVGMLTDRDITIRAVADGRDPGTTTARDIMTGELAWCYEDADISEAGRIMAERGVRRLAVINQEKRMVGMLSVGDLTAASPELAGEALRALSAVEGHGPSAGMHH
jgi:CBS domain-containing protein